MPYLIDSDWIIDYLDLEAEALQRIDRLAQESIAISIVRLIGDFVSHGTN